MIDRSKLKPQGQEISLKILKSKIFNDHEVVLVESIFRHIEGHDAKIKYLVCDCDYSDVNVVKGKAHKCPFKKLFRQGVQKKIKSRYGQYWKQLGLKKA